MRRLLFAWLAVVAYLLGCGEDQTADRTSGGSPAADRVAAQTREPDTALIGSVRTRTHTVRLYAGDRYSIRDADGQVIAADLTGGQFAERFGDLYEDTHEALSADAWAGRDDARPSSR